MEFLLLDETNQKIMSHLWCNMSGCKEAEIQNTIRIWGLKQRNQKKITLHLKELENAGYVEKKCISGECFYFALIDKLVYQRMFLDSELEIETFTDKDKLRILKAIESLENL